MMKKNKNKKKHVGSSIVTASVTCCNAFSITVFAYFMSYTCRKNKMFKNKTAFFIGMHEHFNIIK